MIIDLRRRHITSLDTDICIVGAGPAGIALSMQLAKCGKRVLVIESGGLELDPNVDSLSDGESVGVPFTGFRLGRFRGFGGASRLWAGQCIRFESIDFAARPWVDADGWPVTLETLLPFYSRAERFFGLSGHEKYGRSVWRRFGVPVIDFSRDRLQARFTVYSPEPDLRRTYQSHLTKSKSITVALYGHALRLRTAHGTKRIESLEVGVLGKPPITVRSGEYVLCNGGIEAARLLLLSATTSQPAGNEHDNVGRYYQDHPNAIVATIETDDAERLQRAFTIIYGKGKRFFPKLRLAPEQQERSSVLNGVANLVFEYDSRAASALRAFVNAGRRRKLPPHSMSRTWDVLAGCTVAARIAYQRLVLGRSPNLRPSRIAVQAHVEQPPRRCSRIMLGESLDAFGQPRARIDWHVGKLERRTFATIAEAVVEEFSRLSLGRVRLAQWVSEPDSDLSQHVTDAYHQIGATRMSVEPCDGVVDCDLKVHSIDNLYICSSSVFPTSGYANPTLTIVALAIRLADHLQRS